MRDNDDKQQNSKVFSSNKLNPNLCITLPSENHLFFPCKLATDIPNPLTEKFARFYNIIAQIINSIYQLCFVVYLFFVILLITFLRYSDIYMRGLLFIICYFTGEQK